MKIHLTLFHLKHFVLNVQLINDHFVCHIQLSLSIMYLYYFWDLWTRSIQDKKNKYFFLELIHKSLCTALREFDEIDYIIMYHLWIIYYWNEHFKMKATRVGTNTPQINSIKIKCEEHIGDELCHYKTNSRTNFLRWDHFAKVPFKEHYLNHLHRNCPLYVLSYSMEGCIVRDVEDRRECELKTITNHRYHSPASSGGEDVHGGTVFFFFFFFIIFC